MRYELKREDIFGFVSAGGYETREKGDELQFKRCPYCNGGGSRDEWTFSINMKSGAFCCLRTSCGQQGHFVELCRDFQYRLDFEPPKIYKQLPQRKPEIRNEAIQYLKTRGISEAVTKRFHITVDKDNPKVLVFPFYDEDGRLVFIKYRNTVFKKGDKGSKEWSMKGTMPILFGMDQCEGFGRLIITEGQIDSLSVIEAGFNNAVSVPTGALGFTWLTYCWHWITKFQEIIVFGDCEHGKITLLDTLTARLPKEISIKAVQIKDYLGEKDANDILRIYGPKAVRRCIEDAKAPELENVKELADVQNVDINKMDKIVTGINELDRVIRGMCMGQLVILTGKRGEGKSTFMSQLVADALDQNRTVFVYSGELADFHFKRWLDYQLAGDNHIEVGETRFGDPDYGLAAEQAAKISDWYRGRAFIYDNKYVTDATEFETLPETIEKVILQRNAQLICIDNLMTAMERVTEQNNLYLAQSNFVGRLKAIAVKYSVVILLVAHPKKGGVNEIQDDNDLVAGSSDITNKADIILKYSRLAEEGEDGANSIIKVTKNRIMGVLRTRNDNAIRVRYSEKSKRIVDAGKTADRPYGWEKINGVFHEIGDDDPLPF